MTEEKPRKPGFFRRIFGRDSAPEPEEPQQPLTSAVEEAPEPPPVREHEPSAAATSEAVPQMDERDEEQQNLLSLQTGLQKTRSRFLENLGSVFRGKREIDGEMLGRLEEMLVTADVGVKTAYTLLDGLRERVKRREVDDPEKLVTHLKTMIREILLKVEAPLRVGYGSEPFVVMVVGVNGSGKTTTIAKIAERHKAAGRKVLLAAADTFRAAAVEQIEVWADRIGTPVVKGKDKADPSSVAFEAMERAIREDFELVLVDTAGRLHTRVPLVEELKKVRRTIAKKLPSAPHETLLVIDASMGQNAILQAKSFNEAIPITGIALTKLDGTAKGGVIVGISNELGFPIRYVGVGEKREDLRDFHATTFAEALFSSGDRSEGAH
jgi:fused signal recognition particle receptor